LVDLKRVGDHFYATAIIQHNDSPYNTGGYRGAYVQYHYFLVGEESQIDSSHPYANGHWTDPVVYGDPNSWRQDAGPFKIKLALRANGNDQYLQYQTQLTNALAKDADETSVSEIQWDFAD